MSRVEDVVIKTIISGELPIAGACKAFMNQKTNCFGKSHLMQFSQPITLTVVLKGIPYSGLFTQGAIFADVFNLP